jgi:hypothetical protein
MLDIPVQPEDTQAATPKKKTKKAKRRPRSAIPELERRPDRAYHCMFIPKGALGGANYDIILPGPRNVTWVMSAPHGVHNVERNEPGAETTPTVHMTGEHKMLTGAGWSYRTNDRGWIIYRDPQTRRWHTLEEAVSVMRTALSIAARSKLAS